MADSFLTGVLAVVVAAPCTAPLMGPALGWAFAASTGLALLVFLALGLGLAYTIAGTATAIGVPTEKSMPITCNRGSGQERLPFRQAPVHQQAGKLHPVDGAVVDD